MRGKGCAFPPRFRSIYSYEILPHYVYQIVLTNRVKIIFFMTFRPVKFADIALMESTV